MNWSASKKKKQRRWGITDYFFALIQGLIDGFFGW